MGSLSNLYISQSYTSLIHLGSDTTISATSVPLQDGLGNSIGVSVNSSGDVSLSGSLSASLTQGYTWVGDSNNRTKLVSTSSFGSAIDLTSLNAFTASQDTKNSTLASVTASLNANTASQQLQINSLNSFTASQETKNTTLATYTASVDTKFTAVGVSTASLNSFTSSQETKDSTLGGITGSFLVTASFDDVSRNITFSKFDGGTFNVNISGGSGSYATTGSNTFNGNQIINGTLLVTGSSSTFRGNAFNVQSNDGANKFFVNTATELVRSLYPLEVQAPFTASLTQGYTWVGNASGVSTLVATSSFGGALPTGTVSSSAQITALGFVSSSVTASSLVTASFSGNTLTFTKGNGTTFGVVIPDVSGSDIPVGTVSSSAQILGYNIFATTGSNTFRGVQTISTTTGTPLIVDHANATTQNTFIGFEKSGSAKWDIGNLGTTDSFVIYNPNTFSIPVTVNQDNSVVLTGTLTASLAEGYVWVGGVGNISKLVATSSFAENTDLTSLNAFTASQNTKNATLASYTGSNDTKWSNLGSQSGSWITESETGSFATLGANLFNGNQTISGSLLNQGNVQILGGGSLSIQANTAGSGSLYSNVQLVIDTATDPTNIYSSYQGVDNLNNGLFGIGISSYSGQEGAVPAFYFYGGGQNVSNTPIMTASPNDNNINFWKDNNIFKGNLTVTGSTNITSLTASLQQGYVWVGAANGKTTTVATSSFGGGGAAFPYAGNAQITGSLGVTGSFSGYVNSLSVVANTATIDMNNGNFFTLNLPTGSTTNIAVSNIKAGQTINLQITQGASATGSVTLASNIKFAGGFDYTATAITGAIDLLSFVSFNTSSILATSVKNLL